MEKIITIRKNAWTFISNRLTWMCGKPWSDDHKKKVQYDLKARNILIYSLGVNEYHFVSNCKTAKDMWDALETLHDGTDEVKQ